MESRHVESRSPQPHATEQTKIFDPLSPTNTTFQGPVKTLEQLREALVQKMGQEEGTKMYERFIQSLMVSTFGTIHKDMMRARKASKQMREALNR